MKKKPLKIHPLQEYEAKGWNERSRPMPKKDHPWKGKNNGLKEFIPFRKEL